MTRATLSPTTPKTTPFAKCLRIRRRARSKGGFESLRNAIGDSQAGSPFFRNPGWLGKKSVEQYLDAHGDMTWSADFLADDWTRINNSEVARRAISRIEARGRGILLLHDIHARTVLALPEILNELKSRGYKIVHVVPATAMRPKPATSLEQWSLRPCPARTPARRIGVHRKWAQWAGRLSGAYVRYTMSASLIGRLGSSAFRLSTNSSVDVAHGLSLLFGLGTKGPSIMGFEDEVEQSFGRP